MDVYVLLDVLLVILIALFIPIGFWRGAYREAFVTLGILFGAALGRFWGETWGVELAAVTRLQESGGAFMIAMLCLISATFLLGYSSGAALPVPDPGWVSRILGALIAGANGALLLSFALGDIREYLLSADDTEFLDNATVAPFLAEGTGWILLVAAAIFVPIALVLALFGPEIEEEDYYDDEFEIYDDPYSEPYAQRTMQRPGHAVPGQQQAPRAPAPNPAPAEETRPIPSPGPQPRPQPSNPQPQHGHVQQQPVPQQQPVSGQQAPPEQQPRTSEQEMTQPHRPTFGPQPGREPDVDHGAETRPAPQHGVPPEQHSSPSSTPEPQPGPSFGTHSVEESYAEHQVVFGHRPSQRHEPSPDSEMEEHFCIKCGTNVTNAGPACPTCGASITVPD